MGNNLSLLGRTNEPLMVDLGHFPGGLGVVIGGQSSPHQAMIPPFRGYLPRQEQIPNQALLKKSADGIVYFPNPADSPPLLLQPAPGVGALGQRTLYWFQLHPVVTMALGVLGFGVALLLMAVVVRRAGREKND